MDRNSVAWRGYIPAAPPPIGANGTLDEGHARRADGTPRRRRRTRVLAQRRDERARMHTNAYQARPGDQGAL
jgi:hypothetical protein